MFLPDNQVASISLASALKQKKVIIFRFLKKFSPLEPLSISDMGCSGEWKTLIQFEFIEKNFIVHLVFFSACLVSCRTRFRTMMNMVFNFPLYLTLLI